MIVPIMVLAAVFILIAFRHVSDTKFQTLQLSVFKTPVGRTVRLQIWHIMLLGAIAVLAAGQITFVQAVESVHYDVLLFLLCMFIIGQAMEYSGYLSHISYKLFSRTKSADSLVLAVLFGMGFASAILMNDTIAIIGTSVVLMLAKDHKMPAKILLLALAFAVTIGSALSPIGNPQNLLVAVNGSVSNPFFVFFSHLFLPTVINLLVAYFVIKFFYGKEFHEDRLQHTKDVIKDKKLALLSKISLVLMIALIAAKIVVVTIFPGFDFNITYIALIAVLPIILISPRRSEIARKIDWHTIVFFAAMFVLMESVWLSGFFQSLITEWHANLASVPVILLASVVVSQFVSNVPLVALYLPILIQAGAASKEMVALAAGSTIAGNMFILGAASNVIIIQTAEKKSGETISFREFAKIGIPLTILNLLVYWIFLTVFWTF